MSDFRDRVFVAFQSLLPQHALSAFVGRLTRIKARALVRLVGRLFVKLYDINLEEAVVPEGGYPDFDAFFTRALRPGARTIDAGEKSIVSPVDGVVSAAGAIEAGRIYQAKGRDYSMAELLGSEAEAGKFLGGRFATVYLSPRDYHRMHAPAAGTVTRMAYLPGSLFAVNPHTVRGRDALFSRNERVAISFETPRGPMAMVFVGALIVGSISVAWEGVVAPGQGNKKGRPHVWEYTAQEAPKFAKGDEVGRFHMGSTVIVLVPGEVGALQELAHEQHLQLGEVIGEFKGA